MKKCNKCEIEKELNEFDKEKRRKDGRTSICSACNNVGRKKWQENNRMKYLDAMRRFNRSQEGRYSHLKKQARRRGIEMQISFDQYTEIIKHNKCYYCDTTLTGTTGTTGHSLNRIDSDKGYLVSNVRPCCKFCNTIMSNFTKDELKTRVYKIIKRME